MGKDVRENCAPFRCASARFGPCLPSNFHARHSKNLPINFHSSVYERNFNGIGAAALSFTLFSLSAKKAELTILAAASYELVIIFPKPEDAARKGRSELSIFCGKDFGIGLQSPIL